MVSRVFRANIFPSSFHENSISSCRESQNPQHTISSVFRRLANSKPIKKIVSRSIEMSTSSDFSRIWNQQSSLEPKQSIAYFGAVFLFHTKKIVVLSQDRSTKLLYTTKMLIQGHNSERLFLQFSGIISSCVDLIQNARLYMRPIQLHLLSFGNQAHKT